MKWCVNEANAIRVILFITWPIEARQIRSRLYFTNRSHVAHFTCLHMYFLSSWVRNYYICYKPRSLDEKRFKRLVLRQTRNLHYQCCFQSLTYSVSRAIHWPKEKCQHVCVTWITSGEWWPFFLINPWYRIMTKIFLDTSTDYMSNYIYIYAGYSSVFPMRNPINIRSDLSLCFCFKL